MVACDRHDRREQANLFEVANDDGVAELNPAVRRERIHADAERQNGAKSPPHTQAPGCECPRQAFVCRAHHLRCRGKGCADSLTIDNISRKRGQAGGGLGQVRQNLCQGKTSQRSLGAMLSQCGPRNLQQVPTRRGC